MQVYDRMRYVLASSIEIQSGKPCTFCISKVRIALTSEFLSIYSTAVSIWCLVSYCETMIKDTRNEISCRIQYRQRALQWAREIQTDWNIFTITSDVIKKNIDFCSIYRPTASRFVTPALRCFWNAGGLLKSLSLVHSHILTYSHSFISNNAVSNWPTFTNLTPRLVKKFSQFMKNEIPLS
jgi:hypothetical protein